MGPREIARSEGVTANSTGKSGKSGPKPWELQQYILKEDTIDDKRLSHSDPRLELALQTHGQHPDDFIPSDGDPEFSTLPSVWAPRPTSMLALPPQAIWGLWQEEGVTTQYRKGVAPLFFIILRWKRHVRLIQNNSILPIVLIGQ